MIEGLPFSHTLGGASILLLETYPQIGTSEEAPSIPHNDGELHPPEVHHRSIQKMGLQARHQPRPVVPFYLFVRETPFLDVDLDHTHQVGVKLPIDLLPQFS